MWANTGVSLKLLNAIWSVLGWGRDRVPNSRECELSSTLSTAHGHCCFRRWHMLFLVFFHMSLPILNMHGAFSDFLSLILMLKMSHMVFWYVYLLYNVWMVNILRHFLLWWNIQSSFFYFVFQLNVQYTIVAYTHSTVLRTSHHLLANQNLVPMSQLLHILLLPLADLLSRSQLGEAHIPGNPNVFQVSFLLLLKPSVYVTSKILAHSSENSCWLICSPITCKLQDQESYVNFTVIQGLVHSRHLINVCQVKKWLLFVVRDIPMIHFWKREYQEKFWKTWVFLCMITVKKILFYVMGRYVDFKL